MISTTYGGNPVYLMNVPPDWDAHFKSDISLLRDDSVGASNREARRPYSQLLRLHTQFDMLAQDADARNIQAGLRGYQLQQVFLPFWPALTTWGNRSISPIGGGLKLVFKSDWSNYAIYEGTEPGWPLSGDSWVPLLAGRLEKRSPQFLSGRALSFAIDHTEASKPDWALSVTAVTFAGGPSPSMAYSSAPPIFPFQLDWQNPSEDFTVLLQRSQIGFVREAQEIVYSQINARNLGLSYVAPDASSLLSFFLQYSASAFWAANQVEVAVLTSDIGPTDVVLHVSDTVAIQDGDWLAFCQGGALAGRARVVSHTSSTITIDAALGVSLSADLTVVSHLLLVRFQDQKISLEWSGPDYVIGKLPMREVPAEYTPATDETLGTTLGRLPARGYLLELFYTLGTNTYHEYYTSTEQDITYGGHTYNHGRISQEEIKAGLVLDKDEVTLTAGVIAGTALAKATALQLRTPLFLRIIQVDLAGTTPSNPQQVFVGEITEAPIRGSVIKAKAVTGSTRFDRNVPRGRAQPGCINALFDAGCTLAKADWKWQAYINNPYTPGYPFKFDLDTIVAPSAHPSIVPGAGFFAGGWAEFGTGSTFWQAAILDSTALISGGITITLDSDPIPFPLVADTIYFFPYCGGDFDLDCTAKFNNTANFIGCPRIPLANPSLVRPSPTKTGGKK